VILGLTQFLNEDEAARPLAILWFIVIGLALGAASTLVVDWRILREGPFLGVSLLVVPALLGAVMSVCGWLRSPSRAISHLAPTSGFPHPAQEEGPRSRNPRRNASGRPVPSSRP
jgi:hypothetical protein